MTETTHRLAYSVPAFAKVADVSSREIWRAIAEGKLAARKHGRRTIILHDDGRKYLQGLPRLTDENKTRIRKPAAVQPVEAA